MRPSTFYDCLCAPVAITSKTTNCRLFNEELAPQTGMNVGKSAAFSKASVTVARSEAAATAFAS